MTTSKKTLLTAAFIFCFAAVASAQPRNAGLRCNWSTYELSYQHTIGNNFVEADLGLFGEDFNVAATYNWDILQLDNGLNVYGGPGAAFRSGDAGCSIGIAGQIGIEYHLPDVPLLFSLDLRPQFGLSVYKDAYIISESRVDTAFWGWLPCLGIRYAF